MNLKIIFFTVACVFSLQAYSQTSLNKNPESFEYKDSQGQSYRRYIMTEDDGFQNIQLLVVDEILNSSRKQSDLPQEVVFHKSFKLEEISQLSSALKMYRNSQNAQKTIHPLLKDQPVANPLWVRHLGVTHPHVSHLRYE